MVSATLKGYWLYRYDGAVVFDWKIRLKFGIEKGVFLTIVYFYIKRSLEIFGKGLLLFFYQQASSLIGN